MNLRGRRKTKRACKRSAGFNPHPRNAASRAFYFVNGTKIIAGLLHLVCALRAFSRSLIRRRCYFRDARQLSFLLVQFLNNCTSGN